MIYLICSIPVIFVIGAAIADLLGYFGPSDGAIDAYYRLKETDPERAQQLLNELLPD